MYVIIQFDNIKTDIKTETLLYDIDVRIIDQSYLQHFLKNIYYRNF